MIGFAPVGGPIIGGRAPSGSLETQASTLPVVRRTNREP